MPNSHSNLYLTTPTLAQTSNLSYTITVSAKSRIMKLTVDVKLGLVNEERN